MLEEALRKLNLPYRIFGGISFYKRKEIKDLLAYFRLTINPLDEEAIKRIINYPARGIGKTTIDRLQKTGLPMWEAIDHAHQTNPPLNAATQKRLRAFRDMIQGFSALLHTENAYDLAMIIAQESGILGLFQQDKSTEGVARYELIQELLNGISEFVKGQEDGAAEPEDNSKYLDVYMQDIALLTDADETDQTQKPKISMMTIHQAKGLEFPYVFVTGMEENLFPSAQVLGTQQDLEEERRLFYVALTRAEKRATLSYAESRYKYGSLDFCESSRFIDEIDEQYIEFPRRKSISFSTPNTRSQRASSLLGHVRINAKTVKSVQKKSASNYKVISKDGKKSASAPKPKTFVPDDIEAIVEGCLVNHQRFGQGEVLAIEGEGVDKKAKVKFEDIERMLLLKVYTE
ncbi:MAG: hypothetical protein CSB02_00995 [Bacteroidia bacterium]|nr:MAG: hypothetical protein CSB02_00995 [Bacteroidia bacterium]